jgi:ParB family chromosome partitioning protein
MSAQLIDITLIDPNPYQPRTSEDPEAIERLARSIAQDGLLQPPVVRKVGGRYQLAFGHSRHKAFRWLSKNWEKAGLPERYLAYSQMPAEAAKLDDEAMYRHAITENLQRKDLNPIEEALSMRRAMEDFKYTSDQVGELFGKTGATVRGIVRLLDLPETAQAKVADGTISQGAARALLSARRVLTDEQMDGTLADIEKKAGKVLPEVVVSSRLAHADGVLQMSERWGRQGGQKPRAGSGLWLLDMKNFPNKLLPELSGEWTDAQREHLLNPPACAACPFYVRMAGEDFCGMRACHDRKRQAWKEQQLQSMSKQLGISAYLPGDGDFKVLDQFDPRENKLLGGSDGHLRLVPRAEVKHYYSQYESARKGLDTGIAYIAIVGEGLKKLKANKKADRQQAKALGGPDIGSMRTHKGDLLDWESTRYFSVLFEGLNFSAASALLNLVQTYRCPPPQGSKPAKDAGDDEQLLYLRRQLALATLSGMERGYSFNKPVSERAKGLYKIGEKLGVELPPAIREMAAEMDAEIESHFPKRKAPAAKAAVAAETAAPV